jgi:hypothetical protein
VAISRFSDSSIQDAFPKYNSLWDGRSAVGSMEALGSVTLNAAQSSITFSNIPNTYTDLQIRASFTTSVADRSIRVTFNSDTATNYSFHNIQGDGSTTGVNATATVAYGIIGAAPNSTTFPGIFITDILGYADTNKFKTTRSLAGADMNVASANSSYIQLWSSNWRSTSAITTINIIPSSGNFSQYSTFALYGIK